MLSSIIPTALLGISAVQAAPFKFPLKNGFPDIKVPSPALLAIEEAAHGTLPDAPLLTTLAPEDILNWQVLAFNELFEVGFYTSLLRNITSGVSGFSVPDEAYVLEVFRAIRAQEELHALGANAIIATAGGTPIEPCEYVFPSVSYDTAIDFARTFTDIVLGTLGAVQYAHAVYGDEGYIPLIASILGQEAQQVGFFREGLGLIPSELPFLTGGSGLFAYSILNQLVVVPGSCPNAEIITKQVPILPALALDTPVPLKAETQILEFSFESSSSAPFYLVYINQQNLPIVEVPKKVKSSGGVVTFQAAFPYDTYLMNGLTLGAITSTKGPFSNADDVAAVALAGPAVIEIN